MSFDNSHLLIKKSASEMIRSVHEMAQISPDSLNVEFFSSLVAIYPNLHNLIEEFNHLIIENRDLKQITYNLEMELDLLKLECQKITDTLLEYHKKELEVREEKRLKSTTQNFSTQRIERTIISTAYSACMERTSIPISIVDTKSETPIYQNRAFSRIFGWTLEELSTPKKWTVMVREEEVPQPYRKELVGKEDVIENMPAPPVDYQKWIREASSSSMTWRQTFFTKGGKGMECCFHLVIVRDEKRNPIVTVSYFLIL